MIQHNKWPSQNNQDLQQPQKLFAERNATQPVYLRAEVALLTADFGAGVTAAALATLAGVARVLRGASSSSSSSSNTTVSPFVQGVQILCAMRDLSTPSDAFQWDGSWFGHAGTELIDFYAGTPTLREMIDSGLQSEDIVKVYAQDVALFRHQRKQYLLY
eukprot:Colp12_sorted_trinity150504_noHs@13446